MESLQDPKYLVLVKEYLGKQKDYWKKEKDLGKKVFGEVDKKVAKFEAEMKREFIETWKEHGNSNYSLDKFKFNLDPLNGHNNASVMVMTTPQGILNLEEIAMKIPEKKRNDIYLWPLKEYRKTAGKIEEALETIHLGAGLSNVDAIKGFQSRFNILNFRPGYFKE